MEFLNKKEEVIDLVLTRRGKELLAAEGFNPHYYAFYDDEVLYDKSYAAQYLTPSVEKQNEAETRIRNAVTLKAQSEWTASLAGDDANLSGKGANYRYNNHWFRPLGKSTNFNNYKPAWDIQVIEGHISGSGQMTTSDDTGVYVGATKYAGHDGNKINSPIPAVKHTPFEEDLSIKTGSVPGMEKEYFGEKIPQIQLYCDYLTMKPLLIGDSGWDNVKEKVQPTDDYAILQKRSSDNFVFSIKEKNVDESDSENFTLEVFEYVYDKGQTADSPAPKLKRLYFSADEYSPDTVEYYFNVITDKDVDEKLDIKYIYDSSALSADVPADECK